jgi:hypothetical protein
MDRLSSLTTFMNPYHTTMSLFALSKAVKELLRGGAESQCRDFDRQKSFPTCVLERHPDLDVIGWWVDDATGFSEAVGLSVKTLKSGINRFAGSGVKGQAEWLQEAKLDAMPELIQRYIDQLEVAATRDVADNMELHNTLVDEGLSTHEAKWHVFYLCNSSIEAAALKRGMASVADLSEVFSAEYDGMGGMPQWTGHGPVGTVCAGHAQLQLLRRLVVQLLHGLRGSNSLCVCVCVFVSLFSGRVFVFFAKPGEAILIVSGAQEDGPWVPGTWC